VNLAQRLPRQYIFIAAFVIVAVWIGLTETGRRLPYLVTELSRTIRLFALFPLLTAILCWFIFGHRWKPTGMTGYQLRMRQLPHRQKAHERAGLVVGLLLLPAAFAWMSIHLAAWAAAFTARQPFQQPFTILEIRMQSRGHDLQLWSGPRGESAWLYAPGPMAENVREGDMVCVRGRTSAFGSIVDSIEPARCR
jgi:hypothetical protein